MTPHLLVAEDSATQAEMIRLTLTDAGYAVTITGSGEEALRRFRDEGPFSLVLSDIVMPGIDGFELCRQIKEDAGTASTPVVLLTSLRDPLDVVRALEVGADYFIHKPYEPEQLLSRVRMTLSNWEYRSAGRSRMALELSFMGRNFTIDAERQQLLDLLVTTFEDLVETNTRLRANEEQLAESQDNLATQLRASDLEQRHLAAVLDAMPDAVFITDEHGRITGGNHAASVLTGSALRELTGQRLADAVPLVDRSGGSLPQDENPLRRPGGPQREHRDLRALVRGGQRLPVSVRTATVSDSQGKTVAAIAVLRDISAETFTDPVTGLATRALFFDRLERAVMHTQRSGDQVALLLLGFERLDLVADSYGAEARDHVLAQIAQRLRSALPEADTVGHLGDNELAVLRESAGEPAELLRLAGELTHALSQPIPVQDGMVTLRSSAGVAMGSGQELEGGLLLQQASSAAHRARQDTDRVRLFDPGLQDKVLEAFEVEADLAQALARGELVVHYQPELRLLDEEVVGTEALVRWQHPERGLLPPKAFIDVAEETGLIVPLGAWVLEEACRQTASWNAARPEGLEPLFVAVNLSARQLESNDLLDLVSRVLDETGLAPSSLMLEITETAVVRDPKGAAGRLHALKDLGITLALDDFGTGHSSLEYLRIFPFHVLKIDRSFVQELATPSGRAVVQAVVALGEAFDLVVVAEGVETPEQRDQLAALGCPLAAGFLFERPLAPGELTAALTHTRTSA